VLALLADQILAVVSRVSAPTPMVREAVSPTPVCAPRLRSAAAEWPRVVQNFQLVRLQLGDIAPHLPLTGLELGCKLVNTLAYPCETERKLLHIG
jgi:hypothetical protein